MRLNRLISGHEIKLGRSFCHTLYNYIHVHRESNLEIEPQSRNFETGFSQSRDLEVEIAYLKVDLGPIGLHGHVSLNKTIHGIHEHVSD